MEKPTGHAAMKNTQAARLAVHLRRKAMTYGEMLGLGVSTCPWRRLTETTGYLREGESLVRGINSRGLVTFVIRKAA
jgi:hypothetical protein